MAYRLVITEKPSVAASIAKVIGAKEKTDIFRAVIILSAGA